MVQQRPPGSALRSQTIVRRPARARIAAAVSPSTPAPMTAASYASTSPALAFAPGAHHQRHALRARLTHANAGLCRIKTGKKRGGNGFGYHFRPLVNPRFEADLQ